MSTLYLNNKLFIFSGNSYKQCDLASGKTDVGFPRNISGDWVGAFPTIDAAVNWDNESVYFFQGPQFQRYSVRSKKVEGEPQQTASNWPGVWPFGISAVLRVEQLCYFFKRKQFVTYYIDQLTTENESPRQTRERWKGVWDEIDGAVNLNNGKVLFFKGDNVIRYDLKLNTADAGYPMSLTSHLQGMSKVTK